MADVSFICSLLLAMNLTGDGNCKPAEADFDLPANDPAAWEYKAEIKEEVTSPPVDHSDELARLQAELASLQEKLNQPQFPPVVLKQENTKTEEPVVDKSPPAPPPEMPPEKDAHTIERDNIRAWLSARQQIKPVAAALGNSSFKQNANLRGFDLDNSFGAASTAGTLQKPQTQEEYDYGKKYSSLPVDNSRIFAADRIITGLIESNVNSQFGSDEGGEIVIQTKYDVFGYHGRNILLPMGSRLICSFDTANLGETRLGIICKRILMGGHRAEIVSLQTSAGDQKGGQGVPGEVDNRFFEKYGTAFLLAGVSATYRATTAFTGSEKGKTVSSAEQALDASSQELSQRLGEINAAIIEENVNLKPIISLDQGQVVQLRPRNDWYIRKADSS